MPPFVRAVRGGCWPGSKSEIDTPPPMVKQQDAVLDLNLTCRSRLLLPSKPQPASLPRRNPSKHHHHHHHHHRSLAICLTRRHKQLSLSLPGSSMEVVRAEARIIVFGASRLHASCKPLACIGLMWPASPEPPVISANVKGLFCFSPTHVTMEKKSVLVDC